MRPGSSLLFILYFICNGLVVSNACARSVIQTEVINADLMAISRGSNAGTLLAGGTDGRILRTTSNGNAWQPAHLDGKLHVVQIVARPHKSVLAVTQNGLIRSVDDGQHWTRLPDANFVANRLGFHEKTGLWIAVGTHGEILTSPDDGSHWTLRYNTPDRAPLTALSLARSGYGVAAGAGGHAVFSPDAIHWKPVKTANTSNINRLQPLPDTQGTLGFWSDASIVLFPADGSSPKRYPSASEETPYVTAYDPIHRRTYMATTHGHLFRSTNLDGHWEDLGSIDNILITSLLVDPADGSLTAVGARGLLARSSDGGLHWTRLWDDIWGASLNTAFSPDGEHIVAVGTGGLIMLSKDGGKHWTQSERNLKYYIHEIASTPDRKAVLAVGAQGLILRSMDAGQSWSKIRSGMKPDVTLFSLIENSRSQQLLACGPMGSFLHSDDNGLTWHVTRPVSEAGDGYLRQMVMSESGILLAIGSPGRIVRSTDGGLTWQATDADTHGTGIRDAASAGQDTFFALRSDGQLLGSADGGRHWNATAITDAVNGALYAEPATGNIWVMHQDTLYHSPDRGHSWLHSEMPGSRLNFMLRTQTGTLLGFGDKGLILRSDDNGNHWQPETSGTQSALRKPLEDQVTQTIYVPGRDGTLLFSEDDGLHWQSIETDTPAHLNRLWLSKDGRTLLATGERLVRLTLH